MNSLKRVLYICLIIINLFNIYGSEDIIIAPPQSNSDSSFKYYKAVLIRSLELTSKGYGPYKIVLSKQVVSQGRAEVLLNESNSLTIHRMGTNLKRETELVPIRIPLNKGLLGVRLLLTNSKIDKNINRETSSGQIKLLRACQGSHWPDTMILRDNNYKVLATPNYENMFKMLNHGRCHYFPRSIVEGIAEFKKVKTKYPNIRLNKSVLLSYDFPMYFFVGRRNINLAKRVEKGLLIMSKNGELQKMLENNSSTKDAFPLAQWRDYKIIKLRNKFLSDESPVDDKVLWSRIPTK